MEYLLIFFLVVALVVVAFMALRMTRMTAEREVLRTNLQNASQQMQERQSLFDRTIAEKQTLFDKTAAETKANYEKQLTESKTNYEKQLADSKDNYEKQLTALRESMHEQMETQMKLIREQMQTTSEKILRERSEELKNSNQEELSKIVDPLNQSLKNMREAMEKSERDHKDAMIRLDATIEANTKQNKEVGDTADRLARALTGSVKTQGNFGELKLKQLLEDMGLQEGEQFNSQETIRDNKGRAVTDEAGRRLIPDFILHFPNKRDVVVDSKMSLTAYERYVNEEDPAKREEYLQAHIDSVRKHFKELAKKDYSRFLQEGYNKLNFVFMYVYNESALQLALANDSTLWREAYEEGVIILGSQTMYMNLRILEMMWTQVRQLKNQDEMMKAAQMVIKRTMDFSKRLDAVETKFTQAQNAFKDLRTTTADSGQSIITAAKGLLKAGVKQQKGGELGEETPMFLEE